jgi:hypothetical protein
MVTGIVLEELEVEPVIFGPEVVLLAVVTAVGDVAGNARQNQARESGDTGRVAIYPEEFSGGDSEPRSLTPWAPVGPPRSRSGPLWPPFRPALQMLAWHCTSRPAGSMGACCEKQFR